MFRFKQFSVDDGGCAMKVGTDGVLLCAWTRMDTPGPILDLGCGSGLMALMAAQRCQGASVTGLDIDPDAVECAKANFNASPWGPRLKAVCADALSWTGDSDGYDLIICNPPYFVTGLHAPDSRRATARHDVAGLSPVTALDCATRLLAPGGSMSMVTPAECEDELTYESERRRLHLSRLCRVSPVEGRRPSRLLWQFGPGRLETTSLSIKDSGGSYTPEYLTLVSPFYLYL